MTKKQKALQDEFIRRQGRIKMNLLTINEAWIEIAYDLYWIKQNKCYKPNYKNVYDYAENELGLTRSKMCDLIRVIDVYANRNDKGEIDMSHPGLKGNYSLFTKSQLVVMATLSESERAQITPEMSVRKIQQVKHPNGGHNERIAADIKYDVDAQRWLEVQRNNSASLRDAIHIAIEMFGYRDLHAMKEADKQPQILSVAGYKYKFTCKPTAIKARDYLIENGYKPDTIKITPDKDINTVILNNRRIKF